MPPENDASTDARRANLRRDFPPPGSAEAYAGFEGAIGRTVAESESWWPPRPVAPEGAPNIITVLCDDVGFSDLGCFGGEIDTPNLDQLAAEGLRLTNFQVTPMCSPTRASMLTGMQSHLAGVGHVCHSDAGFPGYSMELADDCATLPEILRDHGYQTMMSGKWHLAKDSDLSDAGPRHSWPVQKGYERYYGFLDGFTNFHHPHRMVRDNQSLDVEQWPDGYYLTDDLTDEAIAMLRSAKAARPDQPVHLYLSHGAAHAPLQAKRDTILKYVERYSVGWDEIRRQRHLRCQELGVVPEGVALPERNTEAGWEAPPWDELEPWKQELFTRYMATYAAMVEHIDESLGALRSALEELGEWDDTLLLFTSDNGASREGNVSGTTSYFTHLGGEVGLEKDHARLEDIGGPKVMAHYPQAWAMACNTPFRLYKTTAHAGGRRVPTIVSWPARITDPGGMRHQYVHITDLLPTVLDVLGVDAPAHRGGQPLKQPTGVSMLPILDDPDAPAAHHEQLYEVWGHRAYVQGDWEIAALHTPLAPFTDDEYELFNLADDPTEVHDLSAEHPEKVAELSAAWEQAAWDSQVFPLNEGSGLLFMIRPPENARYDEPMVIPRGTPQLERWRSLQAILIRSCQIRADVDFRPGDRGWVVAHGDQGGGYGLYVDDDEVVFVLNDGHGTVRELRGGAVPAGTTSLGVDLKALGGGTWTVDVLVGDEVVASEDGFKILFPMAPFQGIDVGLNRRSPVHWDIHEREGTFAYSGVLHRVTYTPGDPAPDNPLGFLDAVREVALAYD